MRTEVIRTGVGSMRNFAPPAQRNGLPPYEACVQSLINADRAGHHWVICHDATDWPTPASAWNEKLSDLCRDAPDPNAVFTMDIAIASAAAQTGKLRFLWGPLDLVRRAPVNIAQSLLTLDHATKGRAAVILAQGQQNHMRQYGISRAGTRDKLWDGVQIVSKLVRQTAPFSYRGRVWKFDNGALALPPYGTQPPEVYVAGGSDESLELTGRFADGWVDCIPGFNQDDPELFGRKVAAVRRHAAMVGRDPDELSIFVLICTVMCEDDRLVEAAIDHPIVRWNTMLGAPSQHYTEWGLPHPYGSDYNYMRDCIPEWISKEEFDDVCRRTPREAVSKIQAVGTPDAVLRRLVPWLDCGVTDLVIYNLAGMCSVAHQKSAVAANAALLAKLKGKPVVRNLPRVSVTQGGSS
jgi:phthiodiolone/phenolphthiodiolone dimycocerosates ketoreductase